MTDTKAQLDAMIVYLLGLIWETGQKLRNTTPKDAATYADTIKTLAQAINQLQWIMYEERADAQPEQPQAEPAEWDALRQAQGPDTDSTQEEPQPE